MPDAPHTLPDHAGRQVERLVFFSDAVFAIAITLLVLDLHLPPGGGARIDFAALAPQIEGFLISFFVVGAYWLHHHQMFDRLHREDMRLRVTNLALLCAIVFLPFPTKVLTQVVSRDSVTLYASSVFAAGLLSALTASAARRCGPEAVARRPRYAWLAAWPVPAVFLLSIPVAQVDADSAMQVWWLAIPAAWLAGRLSRRP